VAWRGAVFVVFCLMQDDPAALEVNILPLNVHNLPMPHSGCQSQNDNRVKQWFSACLAGFEKARFFVIVQETNPAPRLSWLFDAADRVALHPFPFTDCNVKNV
jgi:hypothetical protein